MTDRPTQPSQERIAEIRLLVDEGQYQDGCSWSAVEDLLAAYDAALARIDTAKRSLKQVTTERNAALARAERAEQAEQELWAIRSAYERRLSRL